MGDCDVDWCEIVVVVDLIDCVLVEGIYFVYIFYILGIMGQFKGVMCLMVGYLVVFNWIMKNIYDVDSGEVFWVVFDVGWVVGYSYICYVLLIYGNMMIVFEGKLVGIFDVGMFWCVILEYKVVSFFIVLIVFCVVKCEDFIGVMIKDYDFSGLCSVFFVGECVDFDMIIWVESNLNVLVIDYWWQMEMGYVIVVNFLGIE